MGALSTPGAKVVMAGNPTRTSGFFHDTHHSLRHRWHTMHVNCLDVPRAQGHIEDIKAKYGESSNAYRETTLCMRLASSSDAPNLFARSIATSKDDFYRPCSRNNLCRFKAPLNLVSFLR
jgi:hypothetical protein